jgi:hypothetical protein
MIPASSDKGPSDLAILAWQVRECTMRMFDATEPEALTWTPTGTSNHILWHSGHAIWVADVLTIEPITGRSELPGGWADKFAQNSLPATIKSWPDRAEVRSQLESQLKRVLDLLREQREAIASNADREPPGGGWPLVHGIVHGWHDEAKHQGEIHLLQKLRRAIASC